MEERTFKSHDEMMAYYEGKLHELEVRAKLTFKQKEKAEIGAEIEKMKRLIAKLRKTDGAMIQHADMGERSTEE